MDTTFECNAPERLIERKELSKAELAFADAIDAFRQVSDHKNIILTNMILGHGRRSIAEEMVSRTECLKVHETFQNEYKKTLDTVKSEYFEALRYFGAAKSELDVLSKETGSVSDRLRNEDHTQFDHTYLRFGMFLARQDITTEAYYNVSLQDRKELRKHEISANDATREALTVFESLGEICKQEATYAYYRLAGYQRDCCLKFIKSSQEKTKLPKGESNMILRAKQCASLAEWNWKKALDFYGPETHPTIYI